MKYPTIFTFLLSLFLSFSGATIGNAGTNTETMLVDSHNMSFFIGIEGTRSTIPEMPYIVGIEITPTDVVISAGDSIQFQAESVYNTGKRVPIPDGFVCDSGTITINGLFTSSLAGEAVISINNNTSPHVIVTVLPATPHRLTIIMPDSFDYGNIYPIEGLIAYKLFDVYNNEISLNRSIATYKITKNQPGILIQQMSGNAPSPMMMALAPIIKAGYIAEDGKLLFFERGSYTVTAKLNNITATKVIDVGFESPYQNVIAWKDYRITGIDFDKGLVTVDYQMGEIKTAILPISNAWKESFYGNSLLDKFKIICWGHYAILSKRAEIVIEDNNDKMNKLLQQMLLPMGANK